MKNPVGYFEIPVSNLDRAINFYEKVFGYEFERATVDGNVQGMVCHVRRCPWY